MGTFSSYTVLVHGDGVRLENLTIENSSQMQGQAVALHLEGTESIIINCRLLGNQDTVFTGNKYGRFYFCNTYIEGTTDFIFGPATCWFENCIIHSKADSYITAASTPASHPFGYIFNRCKLTGDDNLNVYLGTVIWENIFVLKVGIIGEILRMNRLLVILNIITKVQELIFLDVYLGHEF